MQLFNFVSPPFISVEHSDSNLTDSTAYSTTLSESEELNYKQDPNRGGSAELTNSESHVIMEEKHSVKCSDSRLSNVPPQQDDNGVKCTGSSLI
ncbi:hypothetical protein DPMN_052832 [Dreissena polymorpha]|uniref:Uncharacterized protein n=1 Tax=Dreissena polymorpha TaxID=45954 RepID=A0A9D4CLZ0_DREPO|nr:hypothetical protein DPMN_052832 [Dreissena polymorpha]